MMINATISNYSTIKVFNLLPLLEGEEQWDPNKNDIFSQMFLCVLAECCLSEDCSVIKSKLQSTFMCICRQSYQAGHS